MAGECTLKSNRHIKRAEFVSLLLPQGLGQTEKWSEKMMILRFQGEKERESDKGGRGGDCLRPTLTIILKTAQRSPAVQRGAQEASLPTAAVQERLGVLQNTSWSLGREWLQRLSHIKNLGMNRYRTCHLSQTLPQTVKNLTLM